ncbi:MAG TPA: hypothetical protein VMW29_04160 [Candidatus Bathyarchaeia archaeon]|nr:hypothetical protein [Candidatus Bathyarchaeia archaeon]
MIDVDYGKIVKRSWELTKRYKWLWVYGLVLAVFGGGGGLSGSTGGGQQTKETPFKNLPEKLPNDLPEKTYQVLGQTTSLVQKWFKGIDPSVWILLISGISLLLLFAVIVSWLIRSWAKGALIAGLEEADENRPVTLLNTSPQGVRAIKSLMIFGLISIAISLAIILTVILLIGSGFFLLKFSSLLKIIWIILGCITGFLTLIFLFMIFSLVNIYAERLIVLRNFSPWKAWKKSLNLSYHNFLPTFLMKIISSAIGCSVGCLSLVILLVIFGIPVAILAIPIFKNGFHFPGLLTIVSLIVLLTFFIYLNFLMRGILVVFNFGIWNLFFKQVVLEENNEE